MKDNYYVSLLIFFSFFINSCKKKNNLQLARNFYEQSRVELEDNNVSKSLQLVNKSIELQSTPQALAFKASLLYQNNEFAESITIYDKLIKDKNTPDNLKADCINNLAWAYNLMGKKEEAKRLWYSLTYNPKYMSPEVCWYNLGLLELNIAYSINPKDEKFNNTIKNAQKYFSKAISISNEFVDAYYYLAQTYIHLKEFNKAKDVIISLLSISPNHDQAKELLEVANKGVYESYENSFVQTNT